VAPPPPATFTARTGDSGRFAFNNLVPGQYRLVATHTGGELSPAEYGQRQPKGFGTTLEVSSGQKVTGAQLFMAPTSVIAGRITDADDEPVANARVMALEAV